MVVLDVMLHTILYTASFSYFLYFKLLYFTMNKWKVLFLDIRSMSISQRRNKRTFYICIWEISLTTCKGSASALCKRTRCIKENKGANIFVHETLLINGPHNYYNCVQIFNRFIFIEFNFILRKIPNIP